MTSGGNLSIMKVRKVLRNVNCSAKLPSDLLGSSQVCCIAQTDELYSSAACFLCKSHMSENSNITRTPRDTGNRLCDLEKQNYMIKTCQAVVQVGLQVSHLLFISLLVIKDRFAYSRTVICNVNPPSVL